MPAIQAEAFVTLHVLVALLLLCHLEACKLQMLVASFSMLFNRRHHYCKACNTRIIPAMLVRTLDAAGNHRGSAFWPEIASASVCLLSGLSSCTSLMGCSFWLVCALARVIHLQREYPTHPPVTAAVRLMRQS